MTPTDAPLIERVAGAHRARDGAVQEPCRRHGRGSSAPRPRPASERPRCSHHAAGLGRPQPAVSCAAPRPTPQERHFPFGVVRTLLEAPLRGALPLDGEAKDNGGATAIAHSLMWLCAGLARTQPLALIVDDAQWSDRSSLEVLTYLAGRIEDLPLLIVVAARFGDPRAPADLLALLGGARSATVLHPQPLTPMGAARLIRARAAATQSVCTERHGATGSNPWLLGRSWRVRSKDRHAARQRGRARRRAPAPGRARAARPERSRGRAP